MDWENEKKGEIFFWKACRNMKKEIPRSKKRQKGRKVSWIPLDIFRYENSHTKPGT